MPSCLFRIQFSTYLLRSCLGPNQSFKYTLPACTVCFFSYMQNVIHWIAVQLLYVALLLPLLPVLGMLLVIRVLHNSHAPYPAFRFPPFYIVFVIHFFVLFFVLSMVCCTWWTNSLLYAFHLECRLWALLIFLLNTFVVILRIHGILSKCKHSLSCRRSLYSVFLPSPYVHTWADTHISRFPSLAVVLMQPGGSFWSRSCWRAVLKRKEVRLVPVVREPQFDCPYKNL